MYTQKTVGSKKKDNLRNLVSQQKQFKRKVREKNDEDQTTMATQTIQSVSANSDQANTISGGERGPDPQKFLIRST